MGWIVEIVINFSSIYTLEIVVDNRLQIMLYGLAVDNHNLIFISIRPFFPTHVKKNKIMWIITQFSVLNVINFLNVYLIVIFETAMA